MYFLLLLIDGNADHPLPPLLGARTRNLEKGAFARGALRKFVANCMPTLRETVLLAYRFAHRASGAQNCANLLQNPKVNFRQVLLQMPLFQCPLLPGRESRIKLFPGNSGVREGGSQASHSWPQNLQSTPVRRKGREKHTRPPPKENPLEKCPCLRKNFPGRW